MWQFKILFMTKDAPTIQLTSMGLSVLVELRCFFPLHWYKVSLRKILFQDELPKGLIILNQMSPVCKIVEP